MGFDTWFGFDLIQRKTLEKKLAEIGGGGGVTSVNGDTGPAITLDANDVGAATSAQGALADTAVQPADLAFAALAGSVSGATGTDLQAILEDLASRITALEP